MLPLYSKKKIHYVKTNVWKLARLITVDPSILKRETERDFANVSECSSFRA